MRLGNFHKKSVLPKLTALYEPAILLNTENCFLPKITTCLLLDGGLSNTENTIVLQFDCYSKFPIWRVILVEFLNGHTKRHQLYSATNRNCQPATRCKEYICFINVQTIITSVPLSSTIIMSATRDDISIGDASSRKVRIDDATSPNYAMNFSKDKIATHNSRIPDKC